MGVNRRLVLLAAAVAALAGWLFLVELPRERGAVEDYEQWRRLLPIEAASVDTLRVERAEAPWTVVRRDDGWWLVEPIEEKAEDLTVASVLARLTEELSYREVATDVGTDEWDRYALSPGHPGRADLVLASRDGGSVRVAVGVELVTGDYCYVRRGDGDALELALISLYELANASHHGFRRMSLFEIDVESIVQLDGVGPSGAWAAVLDTTTGLWWSGPDRLPPRLRRWVLDDVALAVSTQTVGAYLRDGLTEVQWSGYGLRDPWTELHVHTVDGAVNTLWLGNEVEARTFFGRERGLDTVFTIRPGFLGLLEEGTEPLVDRNPVPWNLRRVTTIRVEDDSGRWASIHRGRYEWELTIGTGEVTTSTYRESAAVSVARGLEEVQPLRSIFVPAGQEALARYEEIVARATLQHRDGRTLVVTIGFLPGEPEAWLHVEGDATLYEVPRSYVLRFRGLVDALHADDV